MRDLPENRRDMPAQCDAVPRRRLYTGPRLDRARAVADLRARAHRYLPRIAGEYLEGGALGEQTLARERAGYDDWLFVPHMLRDTSGRSLAADLLGRRAAMPLAIAPTGLNGLFGRHADTALAEAAAAEGVPFIQGTMSNDRLEDVARVEGLCHWWQLYMFGPAEIWQELVDRAANADCEALVLTVNAQRFGRRNWSRRLRATPTRPTLATILDAARHPRWAWRTLAHGMPEFANVREFVPRDRRGLFESAFWIREQMPKSLTWKDIAAVRDRWKGPFFLKGLLAPDDVERAIDAGADGVMLGTHGGRQLDTSVTALDMLAPARDRARGRIALYISGGIRRGTDMLKALALGADAVLAGRAPLYGLCAGGAPGAARALAILKAEAENSMAQLGIAAVGDLDRSLLVHRSRIAPDFLGADGTCTAASR